MNRSRISALSLAAGSRWAARTVSGMASDMLSTMVRRDSAQAAGNHPPWMAGGYRHTGSVSEQAAD